MPESHSWVGGEPGLRHSPFACLDARTNPVLFPQGVRGSGRSGAQWSYGVLFSSHPLGLFTGFEAICAPRGFLEAYSLTPSWLLCSGSRRLQLGLHLEWEIPRAEVRGVLFFRDHAIG